LSGKGVGPSEIWHFVNDLRNELKIPVKYIIQIKFEDSPKESGHVLVKDDKVLGSELSFDKKVKVPTDVLLHSLSHVKHYSMGFPHIVAKIPIKGHDWFLYHTLNEYNTNLIEMQHFKKQFISFLKNHKALTSRIVESEKRFKKYFSERTEQVKVEALSDFLRMKVICDDLGIGSAPYDDCIRILRKDCYRILGFDSAKEGKRLFEEKFPPLPKERYTKESIETVLNFFNVRKRKGLNVYIWKET